MSLDENMVNEMLVFIRKNPKYEKILNDLVDYQEEKSESWSDVEGIEANCVPGVTGVALNHLFHAGFLKKVYESNNYRSYRIVNIPEIDKAIERLIEEEHECKKTKELHIPDDLFAPVVGMNKEIFLIKQSLEALQMGKMAHILFVGLPGTAKSLLLDEINRITGTVRTVGSGSSKVGITDLIFDLRPRVLIIDEFDKMDRKDYDCLLDLQQKGHISETKHGKTRSLDIILNVYAAANDLRGIPWPNLDRFTVRQLKPYSEKEYIQTAKQVLIMREGVEEELAEYIAEISYKDFASVSIRTPIKILNLCAKTRTKAMVDKIVEVLINGREGDNGGGTEEA